MEAGIDIAMKFGYDKKLKCSHFILSAYILWQSLLYKEVPRFTNTVCPFNSSRPNDAYMRQ